VSEIQVQRPEWIGKHVPILYEIRDQEFELVKRGVLTESSDVVPLEKPGLYQMKLFVSGREVPLEVIDLQKDHGPEPVQVKPLYMANLPEGQSTSRRTLIGSANTLPRMAFDAGPFKAPIAWARLWARPLPSWPDSSKEGGKSYEPVSWEAYQAHHAGSDFIQRLKVPKDQLLVLQYAGPAGVFQTVLPPQAVELNFNVPDPTGQPSRRTCLEVDLPDSPAENFVALLHDRDFDRAAEMAKVVTDEKRIFQGESDVDLAACFAGAYYLLQSRQLDRLAGWVHWLYWHAEAFPDTSILIGYFYLHYLSATMPKTAVEESKEYFLQAMRRGLPIFTLGLQFLMEGIGFFREDKDFMAQTADLQRYGTAVQSSQPFVTFSGLAPDHPMPMDSKDYKVPDPPDDGTVRFFS
jgi:hypothetical protein